VVDFGAISPLPWEWRENETWDPVDSYVSTGIIIRPAGQFPHGDWVADCGRRGDKRATANAEAIVRAVNSCMAVRVSELIAFCEQTNRERQASALLTLYTEYINDPKTKKAI